MRRIDEAGPPDPLRRRLAKGALAIPVVLSTLGSRPVLGEVPYNCTISGQLSGNTSSHGPPVSCAIGDSPESYLAQGGAYLDVPFNSLSSNGSTLVDAIQTVVPTDCPTPSQVATAAPEVSPPASTPRFKLKPLVRPPHADPRGPTQKGPRHKDLVAPGSITRSIGRFTPIVDARNSRAGNLDDWWSRFPWKGHSKNNPAPAVPPASNVQPPSAPNGCTAQQASTQAASEPIVVVDAKDTRWPWSRKTATLRQILESKEGGIVPLGRATIASYINARRLAPDYPVTAKRVIDMFNAVYANGAYRVNETTFWGPSEVQAYFETLYS